MSRRRTEQARAPQDKDESIPAHSTVNAAQAPQRAPPLLKTSHLAQVPRNGISKARKRLASLVWVSVAGCVYYFTDIYGVIKSGNYYKLPFNLGVLCFSLSFFMFLYVTLYLQKIQKRSINILNWRDQIPGEIGLATISSTAGFFCMAVSGYRAWGVASPLVVASQLVGLFFLVALF